MRVLDFYQVPGWVVTDYKLSGRQMRVLHGLYLLVDLASGAVRATQHEVGKLIRMNARDVRRAESDLVDLGVVQRHPSGNKRVLRLTLPSQGKMRAEMTLKDEGGNAPHMRAEMPLNMRVESPLNMRAEMTLNTVDFSSLPTGKSEPLIYTDKQIGPSEQCSSVESKGASHSLHSLCSLGGLVSPGGQR